MTTWSTTDKGANIALSGGNLIASATGSGAPSTQYVASSTSKSAGKYVIEFQGDLRDGGSGYVQYGFVKSGHTSVDGSDATSIKCYISGDQFFVQGGASGFDYPLSDNPVAPDGTDVVQLWIDLDNNLIYVKLNGVFIINSVSYPTRANPATPAGGLSIAAGAWSANLLIQVSGFGSVTLNPTPTGLISGWSGWDGGAPAGITGTLAATEAGDTAAINATTRWLATLAATEAGDTALINAAVRNLATLAATEAADICAINASVVGAGINGNLAATEAADTALINAAVSGVVGTLAATEAGDTAAITGTTAWRVTLAATEASDTALINGGVVVGGTLAATEAGDTAAIAATARHLATLAATEAADTALINVAATHTATLAATEAGDTAAINVNAVGGGVNANLAATEAPDTAVLNGAVTGVAGVLAATEAPDTAAVNATTRWLATLAATESPDTAAINGGAVSTGTLAATEAPDTAALTGATRWLAILAAIETPDTAAILVSTRTTATLAAVEAPDTAAITGLGNAFGILAATEAGDTAAITSAKINQVKTIIGQQARPPEFIAADATLIELVARQSSTPNLIAGN